MVRDLPRLPPRALRNQSEIMALDECIAANQRSIGESIKSLADLRETEKRLRDLRVSMARTAFNYAKESIISPEPPVDIEEIQFGVERSEKKDKKAPATIELLQASELQEEKAKSQSMQHKLASIMKLDEAAAEAIDDDLGEIEEAIGAKEDDIDGQKSLVIARKATLKL